MKDNLYYNFKFTNNMYLNPLMITETFDRNGFHKFIEKSENFNVGGIFRSPYSSDYSECYVISGLSPYKTRIDIKNDYILGMSMKGRMVTINYAKAGTVTVMAKSTYYNSPNRHGVGNICNSY